jgi:hypothetical protein
VWGFNEFIWILRGMDPDQSDDVLRTQAVGALQGLLAVGEGRLVLLEWPSDDVVDTYEWERLQPTDWDDPSDGKPYVAITRS